MKRLLFVFLLICIGFFLGFFYRPIKKKLKIKHKSKIVRIAKKTHLVLENKPFVILTMAFNCSAYVERNLLSTLQQNYDNFRIIYIDDASTDSTLNQVQKILERYDPHHRVTLIKNPTNQGAMANLYHAVHTLKSDEIVVIVDGDDFLAHLDVLKELNAYYANPDVWLTYGNFAEYPSYAKGFGRQFSDCRALNLKIIEERGIRKHAFVTSHLRTFYAGLFQRVHLQDFLKEGEFFSTACDVASMLPMVELAKGHVYFVPSILYLYNTENPNADFRKDIKGQFNIEKYVRLQPSYKPLKEHPKKAFIEEQEEVDLVVFSHDRPLQLYAFLESAGKYMRSLHRLFVIYRVSSENYDKGYREVKKKFSQAIFLKESMQLSSGDFSSLLLKTLRNYEVSKARFVMFANDDIVIKDKINLEKAVRSLKKTGAYGFYFRLGKHVDYCFKGDFYQGVPKSVEIEKGIYAWQFEVGQGDWRCPNTKDMALYRKKDIYPYFVCMKFHNPNILEALWDEHADLSKVGLYDQSAKIVSFPLKSVIQNEWVKSKICDISTKQLLSLFEQGLKMNIQPLHQIDNHSIHIEYEPELIKR